MVERSKINVRILTDARGRPQAGRLGDRATLDELLRRAARQRPDALALIDPPNRESFTDRSPRRLTYAEADHAVSAIAGRLRRIGLHTDAIVAVQMANIVENVLTLLGILRAGLIAMPLPLLWRRRDAVTALRRVGATALIVSSRIGASDHFALAQQFAAETFPIRMSAAMAAKLPTASFRSMIFLMYVSSIRFPHGKRSERPTPLLARISRLSPGMLRPRASFQSRAATRK
jgi:non-ribosomal peptide synthetase component E (peptide arylation enzyme)